MKQFLELVPFLTFLLAAQAIPPVYNNPNRGYGSGPNVPEKDKSYKIIIKLDDAFGKAAEDLELIKDLAVDIKLMKVLIEDIVPDIKELKSIVPDIRTLSEGSPGLTALRQNATSLSRLALRNASNNMHQDLWDISVPKSNCAEIRLRGQKKSGYFVIQPDRSGKPVEVYCDMENDGGGWTVIQRRGVLHIPKTMRENFYRNWDDYENGFGIPQRDYWLGLENIHALTADCNNELLVNLTNWEGESLTAKYSKFNISGKADFYRLAVAGYSGTAGDAMIHHNKMRFTTYDKQNDVNGEDNCARLYRGAWWYKDCFWSNLNGEYADEGSSGRMATRQGIEWGSGHFYSYMKTEMKIRPKC